MTATAVEPDTDVEEAPKSKKKLLVIMLVVAIALGAAGYFLVIAPSGGESKPEPGEVVPLDHVQINLAEGHYLRLGISLQLTKDVAHEVDGSKALDAAIKVFSGRTVAELAKEGTREKLREDLMHMLEEGYHHQVMDVYFTEFVTE